MTNKKFEFKYVGVPIFMDVVMEDIKKMELTQDLLVELAKHISNHMQDKTQSFVASMLNSFIKDNIPNANFILTPDFSVLPTISENQTETPLPTGDDDPEITIESFGCP